MPVKFKSLLTTAFTALSVGLMAACSKTEDAPKAAPVAGEVKLPSAAARKEVDPAVVNAVASNMSLGIIASMRPLVNGKDDGVAGVGRYAASVLGISQEDEFMGFSRTLFNEEPGSRLNVAVTNAMATGRTQVIGTGMQNPGEGLSRMEYAALVYPQGGGQVIVRQFMGDMSNPQPLSDNAVLNNNGKLAHYGVAPLTSKAAGYHTIFAADIDAKGNYKVIPQPEKMDLKAYGIDSAFSPAPRYSVDSPAQQTSLAPVVKQSFAHG